MGLAAALGQGHPTGAGELHLVAHALGSCSRAAGHSAIALGSTCSHWCPAAKPHSWGLCLRTPHAARLRPSRQPARATTVCGAWIQAWWRLCCFCFGPGPACQAAGHANPARCSSMPWAGTDCPDPLDSIAQALEAWPRRRGRRGEPGAGEGQGTVAIGEVKGLHSHRPFALAAGRRPYRDRQHFRAVSATGRE